MCYYQKNSTLTPSTMDAYSIYYLSLILQSLISPLLAIWLWVKAGCQPGMKPLALFCLGIGLWGTGQLMINLGSEQQAQIGKMLVNTGPMNAVLFLHFVFRFLGRVRLLPIVAWYIGALLLIVLIAVFDMGQLLPWLGFQRYYVFPPWGWIPGIVVTSISSWAYILLLMAWPAAAPKKRGQILALCLSGVWGSASTLMFLNASFGIDIFPYSIVLLPFYAVLLVFGVVRYDLMAVNLWANRLLAWLALGLLAIAAAGLLISLAAKIGIAPLASLPLWQLWLQGSAMLFTILALERPIRHVMEKFIFPGTHLETGVLAEWRVKLEAAHDWQELEAVASALLGSHLRQTIPVVLGSSAATENIAGMPSLHCWRKPAIEPKPGNHTRHANQANSPNWACDLIAWEGATPSVLRVGEVFGALLAAACARLDQLLLYAEQENRRLQQAHLLELGGLAATVAHELRNPLNIISMAAVSCNVETRAEIRAQIERADHLIQDLLSYSGEIKLNCQPVQLSQLVGTIAATHTSAHIDIELEIASDLYALSDRLRTEQILVNLLNNAIAMLRGRPQPRLRIEAERGTGDKAGMLVLRVCDNGPGVAADLAPDLFQAFKTRRPGGTGLGLAIVRRLTEAHGGQVQLVAHPGWNCCFELTLPSAP
jgi:Histidine kinase-, DNA gyrase B-, and HSP90-like ATPase/N-terminal 7TM region of histidine kinase/His Kinase A (phospho-acceptor) domain